MTNLDSKNYDDVADGKLTRMDINLTFIFYHYGPIPRYLRHAIEHVRIFNPRAEILLVTEAGASDSKLTRLGVTTVKMSDFPSPELEQFRSDYRHISCFKEKFERFVLERWFVTETIRLRRPDRIYVMLDSDVAVFDDASKLVASLPDCPICLASMNPHFTFIRGSIEDFLCYILDFYRDEERIKQSKIRQQNEKGSAQIFNQGEMQFLFDYLRESENMRFYETDTPFGLVDCNIHLPQGYEHMQLPRRPRKKVFWKREDGKLLPYFRKDGELKKAFIIHFQGPGKRVFYRFNRIGRSPSPFTAVLANTVFQHSLVARFC
jgi:hypothetical protein